ncbi:MAG TPA: DUF1292 domain-containing protein [Candidatus Cloacimonadota bacterium]|nr:DUF1292 domain-containing protein [Candidatus Cloacimonadota bacterium]
MFSDKDDELTPCPDCGEDCDCGHDHDDENIITLDMEDGTQQDFLILGVIEYEGEQYVALAEVGSNEYDILHMDVQDETVELNVIDDDLLFNEVANIFEEQLFEGDTEEDE